MVRQWIDQSHYGDMIIENKKMGKFVADLSDLGAHSYAS